MTLIAPPAVAPRIIRRDAGRALHDDPAHPGSPRRPPPCALSTATVEPFCTVMLPERGVRGRREARARRGQAEGTSPALPALNIVKRPPGASSVVPWSSVMSPANDVNAAANS